LNHPILDILGYVAGAYVVLAYLGSKLFPRTENVSASDPRYQARKM
jgi:hypothetical protein